MAAKNEPTRYMDNFVGAVGFLDLLECKLLQLARLVGEMRRAMALRRLAQQTAVISVNRYERRYLERVLKRDIHFARLLTARMVVLEPRRMVLQARGYAP